MVVPVLFLPILVATQTALLRFEKGDGWVSDETCTCPKSKSRKSCSVFTWNIGNQDFFIRDVGSHEGLFSSLFLSLSLHLFPLTFSRSFSLVPQYHTLSFSAFLYSSAEFSSPSFSCAAPCVLSSFAQPSMVHRSSSVCRQLRHLLSLIASLCMCLI